MEITDHTAIRSHLAVRNCDGLIMLGYVAFAIIAVAVLYIASGGPGVTEAELAFATVCDKYRVRLLCYVYHHGGVPVVPWSARLKPELRGCGVLRRTNWRFEV